MLIIADVHLGKVMHFRKAGMPIPKKLITSDLATLRHLIEQHHVCRVLFLGDLFHSQHNSEWLIFEEWLKLFPKISFELALGNHDIHAQSLLPKNIKVYTEGLEEGPFLFTHEPTTPSNSTLYNLCGHLHPAVNLKGNGGQNLKLPCFYFGEKYGIIPAFGRFTGDMKLNITKKDMVFAIAESKVFRVN